MTPPFCPLCLLVLLLAPADAKTAFLVIDVQDCFLESGSLAIPSSSPVITNLNNIRSQKGCLFDHWVFSRDFHPPHHISFASSHGLAPFAHLAGKGGLPLKCLAPASGLATDGACCPGYHLNASAYHCATQLCPPANWNYAVNASGLAVITNNQACATCASTPASCIDATQAMWPDHCLQTGDSNFSALLNKQASDTVVLKGTNVFVDSYSAFLDNTQTFKTTLDATLQSLGVTHLYVGGLATDYCVKYTVRDALSSLTGNYAITLVSDATQAVQADVSNFNAAVTYMVTQGATAKTTAEVLAMSCPASTTAAGGTTTAAATTRTVVSTTVLLSAGNRMCAGLLALWAAVAAMAVP